MNKFESDEIEQKMLLGQLRTKVKNEILTFSDWDRLKRFFNSADFDRASYEADGGDGIMDDRRAPLFTSDEAQDKALYGRAEQASMAAYSQLNWKFIAWWYKKQGGKF